MVSLINSALGNSCLGSDGQVSQAFRLNSRRSHTKRLKWRAIDEQPQIDGRLEYDTAQFCLYGFAFHLHSHQLTSEQQS